MQGSQKFGWATFLITLAALAADSSLGLAAVTDPPADPAPSPQQNPLESRMNRIATELQARAAQLPANTFEGYRSDWGEPIYLSRGFGNVNNRGGWVNNRGGGWRNGGGGWVNTRGPGWVNGGGGTFANWNNPWRNGWGDGGGFWNW